jgi:type III pantothenate kinase
MVTLLNIGNTHTQIGQTDGCHVALVRRLPTSALVAGRLPEELRQLSAPCLAACVVPSARIALEDALPGRDLVFLCAALVTEVSFAHVDASTLGADRIANAVAAAVEIGGPVVVLDCGTCLTTEAVDAQGCFRGGAILPGRALLRRALSTDTGQLPLVALAEDCPAALGTCTCDAILAGVDLGILGAVQRLLTESRAALGAPGCPVIAVGGDAGFFCRHLPDLTPGDEVFTLRGLGHVAARLFP